MKSKGAFEPHGDHGVANNSFFSSSSSSSDESEHHQLYHHHHHHLHQRHDRQATPVKNHQNMGGRRFEPLFKWLIPFAKHSQQHHQRVHQPAIIFITWCLVVAITSTSLIDCVYAGAGTGDVATKSAFGSASLPVYNLGPEITTEFGEYKFFNQSIIFHSFTMTKKSVY